MLVQGWSTLTGRAFATVAVALTLSAFAPAQPALAQGLFEALFGSSYRRPAPPPRMHSYADPFADDRRERRSYSEHTGPSSGFCVRTCDGWAFRVRSGGGMSAADLCRSFCPATKTKIFSGSKIDHAVASDGQRYADLDSAFLYRERRVDNCTCNSKDTFGLARIDVALRPDAQAGRHRRDQRRPRRSTTATGNPMARSSRRLPNPAARANGASA